MCPVFIALFFTSSSSISYLVRQRRAATLTTHHSCYVRARRLNVIIQPHLRFAYELLKWEEDLAARKSRPLRRDLEWATIAREIAALNRPYCRPSG